MYRTPPAPRDLNQPAKIVVRETPPGEAGKPLVVTCCVNVRREGLVCCGRRGSKDVAAALRRELKRRKLAVTLQTAGCLGPCNDGPNIRVEPSNSWVFGARLADVERIADTIAGLPGATAS